MATAVAGIEVGLAVLGVAGSIYSAEESSHARQEALKLRMQQEQASANQRSLQLSRKVNNVLSAQKASEAASGFSSASPSFGAISEDTINEYAQDENANKLNESFQIEADRQGIQNAKDSAIFGVGSSLFDAADTFYNSQIPSANSALWKRAQKNKVNYS